MSKQHTQLKLMITSQSVTSKWVFVTFSSQTKTTVTEWIVFATRNVMLSAPLSVSVRVGFQVAHNVAGSRLGSEELSAYPARRVIAVRTDFPSCTEN